MRKLSLGFNITLDGFIAGPRGELNWISRSDETTAYIIETMENIDTMLMGRVNFLEQQAFWPTSNTPLTPAINSHEKVVFSNSPITLDWDGSRVAELPLVEEVARLKALPGKTIGAAGGARFAQSLLSEGLVDEVRLIVNPVTLGEGLPLFIDSYHFDLEFSRRFDTGAVLNRYRPSAK